MAESAFLLKEWIKQTIRRDSVRRVAQKTGLPLRSLYYKLEDPEQRMNIQDIITIAQAYGHNPITDLVQLGYIKQSHFEKLRGLDKASNAELLGELARRLSVTTMGPDYFQSLFAEFPLSPEPPSSVSE